MAATDDDHFESFRKVHVWNGSSPPARRLAAASPAAWRGRAILRQPITPLQAWFHVEHGVGGAPAWPDTPGAPAGPRRNPRATRAPVARAAVAPGARRNPTGASRFT